MAQHAIESDNDPTEGTASRECQQCGEAIPGQPFYAMRDVVRNAAGEFVPTTNADAFCDVQCQRQSEATEGGDA
jgi:hypothetical protein